MSLNERGVKMPDLVASLESYNSCWSHFPNLTRWESEKSLRKADFLDFWNLGTQFLSPKCQVWKLNESSLENGFNMSYRILVRQLNRAFWLLLYSNSWRCVPTKYFWILLKFDPWQWSRVWKFSNGCLGPGLHSLVSQRWFYWSLGSVDG